MMGQRQRARLYNPPASKDILQKAFLLGRWGRVLFSPVLLLFLCMVLSTDTMAWGSLQNAIQAELDGNPFLKEAKIKLRVIDEKNGYVTLEMSEGERALREGVSKGFDINDNNDSLTRGHYCYKCSESNLNILKKSINVIRQMQGVKEVLLKAAVNTPLDQADKKFDQAIALWEKKKYEEAVALVRPCVEMGHAPSQRLLGFAYKFGNGVVKDLDNALQWLIKAAENGDSIAQRQLGTLYLLGDGVTKDYNKAVLWLQKAADREDSTAQTNLGYMYAKGYGVTKDHDMANQLWQKAAERGDQRAAGNLAWQYAVVPHYHDGQLAVKFAQKAINSNEKNVPEHSLRNILAVAFARNNQFGEAVKNQERAIRLLDADTNISLEKKEKELNKYQDRLLLYKSGKPYTEKDEGSEKEEGEQPPQKKLSQWEKVKDIPLPFSGRVFSETPGPDGERVGTGEVFTGVALETGYDYKITLSGTYSEWFTSDPWYHNLSWTGWNPQVSGMKKPFPSLPYGALMLRIGDREGLHPEKGEDFIFFTPKGDNKVFAELNINRELAEYVSPKIGRKIKNSTLSLKIERRPI